MRLKEPLYGIRIGQMHYLMHFTMFCTMIYLMSAEFSLDDYKKDVREGYGRISQVCAHNHLLDKNAAHGDDHSTQPVNHFESLLLMPSNEETGEYYLQDQLKFGYNHLKEIDLGSFSEHISNLAGTSEKKECLNRIQQRIFLELLRL